MLPLQLDSACESIATNVQEALDNVVTIWKKSSEVIKRLLLEDEGLKRVSYKLETLPDKLHQLETLVNTTSPGLLSKDEMKCAQLFTASVLKEKTKKNHQTPHHAFFDVWEAYITLTLQHQICNQQAINQIRLQLLEHLRISLKQIKHEQGILSYDDLLLRLHEALTSESGSTLARQISKRFPVALIDEFQDTDPVQYEIFDSIYHPSNQSAQALFLVGDPKQAIYSFRGADIYTYIRARETAQKPWWTLTQNWRSSQRMVTAINILFQHNQRPFLAGYYQLSNC